MVVNAQIWGVESCFCRRVPCTSAGAEVWAEDELPILGGADVLTPLGKSFRA